MTSALRVVREDQPTASPQDMDDPGPVACILPDPQTVDRHELAQLQQEVALLRRRDEALKVYVQQWDEELRLAARLQQDFLPKVLPSVGPVRFHTLYRPAGYVSGDLYDVMRLDESHVGFYLADAVGHGMPAALLTMFLKHALITKEISGSGYRLLSPGESMARLNESLVEQNLSAATFATALYGIIDTRGMTMSFARAGHPGPLLMREGGTIEALESDGGLLGIFPDETFTEVTVSLNPGDKLFAFTDGVEVAFSDDGLLNTQKWLGELQRRSHLRGQEMLEDLVRHLDGEVGSLTPKDDLTMVIAEVTPDAAT